MITIFANRITRRAFLASLFFCLYAASGSAQTILIHTGYNTPNPSLAWQDGEGQWWNRLGTWQALTKSNLVDTQNSPTGINWVVTDGFYNYTSNVNITGLNTYPPEVSRNGFYLISTGTPDTTAKGYFENLDINMRYNLTFYGATITEVASGVPNRALSITISGYAAPQNQLLLLDAPTAGVQVFDEITFWNIQPDINGKINVDFLLPEGFKRGTINAITLTVVPEPGTVSLLLLSASVIFFLRRKFSR